MLSRREKFAGWTVKAVQIAVRRLARVFCKLLKFQLFPGWHGPCNETGVRRLGERWAI